MNRSHESLIRLARFRVESLQKQMAELDRARAGLHRRSEELEARIAKEQEIAGSDPALGADYGAYAKSVIERRENLQRSLSEVDGQAENLREDLRTAFEELKKYELIEERRLAKEKAEAAKAERDELDEAGSRLAG